MHFQGKIGRVGAPGCKGDPGDKVRLVFIGIYAKSFFPLFTVTENVKFDHFSPI